MEWISVDDRLPEANNRIVSVTNHPNGKTIERKTNKYCSKNVLVFGFSYGGSRSYGIAMIEINKNNDSFKWVEHAYLPIMKKITHWTELHPPKVG